MPMFDFAQLQVTDQDIAKVEQHFGFNFHEAQKEVIRHWDNAYIQACPGGGKTTTLAAKLMILADKLPKSFHQGICIITHTNTAVKEIKEKLGDYANFYTQYPHHFGTIQSFVDKFLAIPLYKSKYKTSPKIVDENILEGYINKKYPYNRTISFYRNNNIEPSKVSFNIFDFTISKNVYVREKINVDRCSEEVNNEHYEEITKIKKDIVKNGYLKYDEAYAMAFFYLRYLPSVKELIAKRFPIIFIDEMQDMEIHQSKLIKDLFEGTNAIIQKIGDVNQSIYSYASTQEGTLLGDTPTHRINYSTRLPHNIAQIIAPICLQPQENLQGHRKSAIPPTIIVFDDNTIPQVKEKFVELIKSHNLEGTFKAVGQRKSEPLNEQYLNIDSYWSEFQKTPDLFQREEYSTLASYLDKCAHLASDKNVKDVKNVRRTILSAVCYALKLADVKHPLTNRTFTTSTLMEYLASENEVEYKKLNLCLSKWILNFQNTPQMKDELSQYISSIVTSVFNAQPNTNYNNFLSDANLEFQQHTTSNQVYKYQDVEVHFDTIHGVKGETHTATLYLETFNRIYDIGDKILDFIVSQNKQHTYRRNSAFQKRLPLAYVVMSRPNCFLCLAVHKSRFNEGMKAYFDDANNGWKIEYL